MVALAIDMTEWGALLLAVGAIGIGLIGQAIGDVGHSWHWAVVAIVAIFALIGGLAASEYVVDWRAFGPVWEGLALLPALIGAAVVGAVTDVVVRTVTGGSYRGGAPA